MGNFLKKTDPLCDSYYQVVEAKPHKATISDTNIANVLQCLQDVSIYDYYTTKKL